MLRSKKTGFTLLELMITIAIISILVALLVPNIDRSLSKNSIADDVELFHSKVEEARLLSGSTQQIDEPGTISVTGKADVGYYGIFVPKTGTSFYIIKVSQDINAGSCSIGTIISNQTSGNDACVVSTVNLGSKETLVNTAEKFILFRTPIQEAFSVQKSGTTWNVTNPTFRTDNPTGFFKINLNSGQKIATVNVDNYTAVVTATYN